MLETRTTHLIIQKEVILKYTYFAANFFQVFTEVFLPYLIELQLIPFSPIQLSLDKSTL